MFYFRGADLFADHLEPKISGNSSGGERGVPPINVAMSKVHFRMGERLPWHFGSCVLRTSAGAGSDDRSPLKLAAMIAGICGTIGYKNPDSTRPKNPMVYHIMSLIFNFFMTVTFGVSQ